MTYRKGTQPGFDPARLPNNQMLLGTGILEPPDQVRNLLLSSSPVLSGVKMKYLH